MKIYLLRHGRTHWNDEHRYQGKSDIPLSKEGENELIRADFLPDVVYVSPLCRTWQTASRLFPHVRQVIIPGFTEIDFGLFEGRTADEMKFDISYRTWVDGGCLNCCPSGEDRKAFVNRVSLSFETLLLRNSSSALIKGNEYNQPLTIVAHSGTLMAIMEKYAFPPKDYFSWHCPHGCGFVLRWDTIMWNNYRKLIYLESVCYVHH